MNTNLMMMMMIFSFVKKHGLTSVTANTRFPQGTTLYHLSCSRSMYPSDLYLLINSEMLEVKGEF